MALHGRWTGFGMAYAGGLPSAIKGQQTAGEFLAIFCFSEIAMESGFRAAGARGHSVWPAETTPLPASIAV